MRIFVTFVGLHQWFAIVHASSLLLTLTYTFTTLTLTLKARKGYQLAMPFQKGPTNKVTMSLGNLQVGNRRAIWESCMAVDIQLIGSKYIMDNS